MGLFSLVVTLLTGAGVGGWAYPDTPLFGRIARVFVASDPSQVPPSSVTAGRMPHVTSGIPPSVQPSASGNQAPTIRDRLTRVLTPRADAANSSTPHPGSAPHLSPETAPVAWADPRRDYITIASYNIQVFGASKLGDSHVMPYLADIARRFDLLAIQEIRTQDDQHMARFLQMINATGRRYHYVVGPRQGRTSSTEQYAFVYDTEVLEHHPSSTLAVKDPEDDLHRPPLLGLFRARTPNPADGFTFWLMNIHTDPDEVSTEVDALAVAFQSVQRQGWGEDDVILLGDLNANERQLGKLGTLPGMMWVVRSEPTNTRRTKSYDNLLFDRRATVEFLGQGGVLDVMREYRLTEEQALRLSDHLPVWAAFSRYENGRRPVTAQRTWP